MRRYFVFIVLGLGLLAVSISGTSVAVAFPHLTAELNTTLVLAGWVIGVTMFVAAVSMPVAGKISDILGRKFIFMFAVICFIVGSLISALAPNIGVLIFARFIQGLGGGGILPSATGIAVDEFASKRHQVVGLFSSIFAAGQIIGPNLGGWMVEAFGWRSIFWINIPLGLIVLLAGYRVIQPSPRQPGKIDVLGAGLLTVTLGTFLVAVSSLGGGGEISWVFFATLVIISALFLIIFIRYERSIQNPIIDLEILREKPFIAANIYNFILGFSALGVMSFLPLYAVSVYGVSTFVSGAILTPRSIALIAASTLVSAFILKWGYRKPMLIGSILFSISLVLLGMEPAALYIFNMAIISVAILIFILFLSGLGSGIAIPAANNACIELMPERVSTITGIRGMFRQCGSSISIAVISLILQTYQDNMALGFSIIFFGLAAVTIISLPAIFFMPSSATATKSGPG